MATSSQLLVCCRSVPNDDDEDGLATPPDPATAAAELVLSVLDTLADAVLTACTHAPLSVRTRLVGIVDAGVVRGWDAPEALQPSARFSHGCLRKLFVLCSRGVDAQVRGAHEGQHASAGGSSSN